MRRRLSRKGAGNEPKKTLVCHHSVVISTDFILRQMACTLIVFFSKEAKISFKVVKQAIDITAKP